MACKLVILIHISASVSAEIRTAEFILDKAVRNSKESSDAIACGHKSITSGWKHFSMQADKECREWTGHQTDAGDSIITGSKVLPACESTPCLNNGNCTDDGHADQYTCECRPGYTGANCETGAPDLFGDPLGGRTYHVQATNKSTYTENWDYCAGLSPFSYLLSMETSEEAAHVQSLVTAAGLGCDLTWTGAVAEPTGSTSFYWHYWDGSKALITYNNWSGPEPNNAGVIEDYILMFPSAEHKWFDMPFDVSTVTGFADKVNCVVCEHPI